VNEVAGFNQDILIQDLDNTMISIHYLGVFYHKQPVSGSGLTCGHGCEMMRLKQRSVLTLDTWRSK
jgi:hypothetical protein